MSTTSTFNVEASLNYWFQTQVAAQSLPAWLTSVPVVFDMQEVTISLPCLSVVHIGVASRDIWQGRHVDGGTTKGLASSGLMQIDAWASRSNVDWYMQMMSLDGLVRDIFVNTANVVISNWQAIGYSGGTAAALTYKIDLSDIEYLATAPDPNPDIERRRFLVRYDWTQRG